MVGGDELNKGIFAHRLQGVVVASLRPYSRYRLGTQISPAQGACTVCRVHEGLVREQEELLMQGVV